MGFPVFSMQKLVAKYGKPKMPKAPNEKESFDPEAFKQRVQEVGEEQAEAFLTFLLLNIESNTYGFTLKPETIQRKGSDTPWIETKQLVNAIERRGAEVGFKSGRHKSGLTFEHLAMILEYGMKERGIPPRDVFRRSFADFKKEMIKNVIETF